MVVVVSAPKRFRENASSSIIDLSRFAAAVPQWIGDSTQWCGRGC